MADPEYTDGSAPAPADDTPAADPSEQLAAAVESLHHELEALEQYDQWLAVTDDADLEAILTANRDDEYDHANKLIGWIVQNDPTFDADAATASLKEATMAAVTERSLGGKPKPGTKPDKRLKENSMADDEVAVPDTGGGTPFTALMMIEGYETSDGRMFELGSTTWRNTPLPLMVQDTSPHGPGQTPAPAWAGGSIDTIERDPTDPSRIIARGHLIPGEIGDRAENIIRHSMRGVSIDGYGDGHLPPDQQPTAVDQDGNPISVLVRYADTVISRLTVVPTPAFAPACIWFDDEEMPQAAAEAHGTQIDTDAKPEVVQVPEAQSAFFQNMHEMLVASGGGPLNPPKEWFFTPEPNHRQEMILTADGRLTGHLVGKGECHTGYTTHCETAPTSKTTPPFKGFHISEAHCADGEKVACGLIPLNTNHGVAQGAAKWTQEQTWEHYENSGLIAAKVRASNGRHGIWLSGCIMPGLKDRELSILQGLVVSGHWNVFTDSESNRRYPDELLGVLGGLNMPGYPAARTRPELLVASGAVVGRIGNIDCGCEDCDEEAPLSASDKQRLEKLEQALAVLANSAPEDVQVALAALADDKDGEIAAGLVASAEEAVSLEHGADELAVEGTLIEPLTTVELATWSKKYDFDSRVAARSEGRALRDGSLVIEDADDLKLAIRSWRGEEGVRQHIIRNAERLDVTDLLQTAEIPLGKYNADDLRKMAKAGQALPPAAPGGTPSYPIADADDLEKAIHAVGRGGADHDKIRAHIIKRAKALGKSNMIPDNWSSDGSIKQ